MWALFSQCQFLQKKTRSYSIFPDTVMVPYFSNILAAANTKSSILAVFSRLMPKMNSRKNGIQFFNEIWNRNVKKVTTTLIIKPQHVIDIQLVHHLESAIYIFQHKSFYPRCTRFCENDLFSKFFIYKSKSAK